MYFRSPRIIVVIVLVVLATTSRSVSAQELRVCADPDNMPFSDSQKRGFENAVAEIIAKDLHQQLVYVWQRMGRGFVRDFLNQSRCDLLIGIPSDFRAVSTTKPYYRSTYTFVVRSDSTFQPKGGLDDPALAGKRIGIQALDEQYTPPGEALVRRGMQNSLRAYHTVGGDANSIIQAVLNRDVDVAIVWGPLAGFYSHQNGNALRVIPIVPDSDGEGLPFTFQISMGVRKGDDHLRMAVDDALERSKVEITGVLNQFGVPQLSFMETGGGK